MNRDREHKIARLRSLALQIERGELDREFTPAVIELGVDPARLRRLAAEQCRRTADELEGQS
jgi:hypothetical protein